MTETCGQAADAEVGGMEESEFVGGAITEQEYSADFGCREAIEELAWLAATADASDIDVNVGRIVGGVASPEEASGHEFRAGALGFPGVPIIDLSGALADGFSELAVDGADGIVAQLQMELALR